MKKMIAAGVQRTPAATVDLANCDGRPTLAGGFLDGIPQLGHAQADFWWTGIDCTLAHTQELLPHAERGRGLHGFGWGIAVELDLQFFTPDTRIQGAFITKDADIGMTRRHGFATAV